MMRQQRRDTGSWQLRDWSINYLFFTGKKQQLVARLARKAAAIEDLLYSSKNFITIKEKLAQYDDIFKLIIKNHEENCKILRSEEQLNEEYHFEDVDQRVFIFKYKVRKWLKDAEDEYDQKSKSSGRSSKARSSKEYTRSSRSSKASSSRSSEGDSLKSKVSSKPKAVEQKVKIDELVTEAKFMEKRRMIEMEAERLHIQKKVAKAQAKFRI